jgi:hypothetical protein
VRLLRDCGQFRAHPGKTGTGKAFAYPALQLLQGLDDARGV